MKLSDKTLSVLKSFSSINPSIVIKPGNKLRTIHPGQTIMAEAEVPENFEHLAGIYNLSRFLATHSLFENPDLEFGENQIEMTEKSRNVQYTLAEPSMIVQPPEKNINMPECEIQVEVDWETLESILKSASVLGLPEIAFTNRNNSVHIAAIDAKKTTNDTFSIDLNVPTNDDFLLYIRAENFKLLPAKYVINLSSKGLANLKSDTAEYWIAVESKSTYKKNGE